MVDPYYFYEIDWAGASRNVVVRTLQVSTDLHLISEFWSQPEVFS